MQTGKNLLVIVMFGVACLVLPGCYTMEGAGRDVASAGAGITAGAEEVRRYQSPEERGRR